MAPRPARDHAFEPGVSGIRRPTGIRHLPGPGGVEGLIWWLGPQGERLPGAHGSPPRPSLVEPYPAIPGFPP
jgi:hypothetical protein